MTQYLILTSWSQRERYDKVEEFYQIVKEITEEIEGVETFGLYRPLTEDWHWSYLLYLDNLEKWNRVNEESEKNFVNGRDNIIRNQNRIFVEKSSNPLNNKLESLKILELELILWNDINIGSYEYFESISSVLKDKEGVWFLGQYGPANEPYNWTHCFMYDSLSRITEVDIEVGASAPRPKNASLTVEWLYKRIEL
ncbi:hypothetical protein E4H04_05910 [Candidatus Bathyarchaeota archaeon]|nr:MAG: hypothetical protein E4H04_05910 [Candidatus Bathyarchaeota archaeon]